MVWWPLLPPRRVCHRRGKVPPGPHAPDVTSVHELVKHRKCVTCVTARPRRPPRPSSPVT
jgi:hypothetical protein